jgi:hypothetical protein
MKGWVYVITNKAMPGLIKVGYSTRDPEVRAAELNHTGAPHPYMVAYEVLVDNPRQIEKTAHTHLKPYKEGKEWFRCTPEEAVVALKTIVGTLAYLEHFKRVDRLKVEALYHKKLPPTRAKDAPHPDKETLDKDYQETVARYELMLQHAFPPPRFWRYFVGIMIGFIVIFNLFFPFMSGFAIVIVSVPAALLTTPLVRFLIRRSAKKSQHYQEIIARKEADLKHIEQQRQRSS